MRMDDASTNQEPGASGEPSTPTPEGTLPSGVASGARGTPEELATVRELALHAHPDTVPELVGGATVAEIVASLEPARAAYRRIAERAAGSTGGTGAAPIETANRMPPVPAGDAPRVVVDPDRVSAAEKIRRGLEERRPT